MHLPPLLPNLSLLIANLLHNNSNPSTPQTQTSPPSTTGAIPSTTTTTTPAPSTTPPPPPPTLLAARANSFTNPLLPTHPTIFYITATAYSIISGSTIYTTYTQLVSGTSAIPWTASTQIDLSALAATATSTSSSTLDTSLVFPVQPSVPPGSPTPTLDLGVCSTATGGVKACGDGVIGSFNSRFGGRTSSSGGGGGEGSGSGSGSGSGVVPTRTVTATYLGAEVAKGKATWGVGVKGNGGVRVLGHAGWRVIWVLVVVVVGWVVIGMFGWS